MNRKTMYLSVVSTFAGALISLSVMAEKAADILPQSLLACADETDVMLRLSCFDREIATLKAKPAAAPAETTMEPSPATAAAVTAAAAHSPSDLANAPIATAVELSPSPTAGTAAINTACCGNFDNDSARAANRLFTSGVDCA